MGPTTTIRVATASPGTGPSRAATLSRLEALARRAASPPTAADLLLLPEAFIGGYPRGSAFGCVIGDRSAAGRDEYARYYDDAVDLGDTVGEGGAGAGDRWIRRELPAVAVVGAAGDHADGAAHRHHGGGPPPARGDGTREELERIARETGVFVVTGLIEKAGGSLYCSVVYVCPREGIIGKRRKVLPVSQAFELQPTYLPLSPQLSPIILHPASRNKHSPSPTPLQCCATQRDEKQKKS